MKKTVYILTLALTCIGCNPRKAGQKPQTLDKLPVSVLSVLSRPDLTQVIVIEDINPFYIVTDFDGDEKPDYVIYGHDQRSNEGCLILIKNDEAVIGPVREIYGKGGHKIAYIKATAHFPSGAALKNVGGGAVVQFDDDSVRWLYYDNGWVFKDPD